MIKHLFINNFIAFTLAETLIVMGIIGIVSALTLPNLNSSTGEKEKVAKVMKIYSNLEDALGRAEAIYGPVNEWFSSDSTYEETSKRFAERMSEFLKVSKNCGSNTGCWSTSPLKNVDGSYYESASSPYYNNLSYEKPQFVILADGTAVSFSAFSSKGEFSGKIRVDIDGPNKGKTQIGNDEFNFAIHNYYSTSGKYEVLPSFYNLDYIDYMQTPLNYETLWVVATGNLDYLKADNNGKCKNGKVLNWTTNTTCS